MSKVKSQITTHQIATPIGTMLAGETQEGICFLEFINPDESEAQMQMQKLEKYFNATLITGKNQLCNMLDKQLTEYFNGKRKAFDVPLVIRGTVFQKQVWKELQNIPYGKTISYQEQARNINKPKAVRAVANANGKNKISIIIPCHRVIGKDGSLTGYNGELWRKKFLLDLERK